MPEGNLDIEDKGSEMVLSVFNGDNYATVRIAKDVWIRTIKYETERLDIK